MELNRDTIRTLSIAFAQVYLRGDRTYDPFLSAAYIETISEAPFLRHLVRELPPTWAFPATKKA